LKTTTESTPTAPKIKIAITSLTPIPDIPTGKVTSIITDNKENIKKMTKIFVNWPKDKNKTKNNNASKKVFIIVIIEL